MANIRISSLNVRGLQDEKKRKELYNILYKENPTIVCLQETHSTAETEIGWAMQWGGEIDFAHGSSNSQGVCIMYNKNIKELHVNKELTYKDTDGRVIMSKITIQEKCFLILNVYAPNIDDAEFFINIFKKITEANVEEIIICGDFNLVLQPHLDRKEHSNRYKPNAFKVLEQAMEELDLFDLWRCKNPDKVFYTWTRVKNKRISASRIDFALLTPGLANLVKEINYSSGYKTDHAQINVNICLSANNQGPGYWKLNSQLIRDRKFVTDCNYVFEHKAKSYEHCDDDEVWELLKCDCTLIAKNHGKQRALDKRQCLNSLHERLSQIEQELFAAPTDTGEMIQLHKASIEKKIEALIKQ